jgi:predicted GNAT superfamily acetyltransferase
MQLDIRPVADTESFLKIIDIQRAAWGIPDAEVTPTHVLHAALKAGGQILAAFDPDGTMVGFSFGLYAREKDTKQPYLLSHMVAVIPTLQSKSVGEAIKLAQKKAALADGISVLKWTYDPLLSKNANLNLRKLGATVFTFVPNQYGEIKSDLYGSFPTDRFEVTWDLTKDNAVDFPANIESLIDIKFAHPQLNSAALKSGAADFSCPIPLEHAAMRKENPGLAREWQTVVRTLSMQLLDNGYCIANFRKSSDNKHGEYLFHKLARSGGRK